ncbi:hypothetical protein LJ707_13795 [Mucilaginibacter sp. UR6-1]|uniref:S41 family peptidase n=1 Tax=Mucilaginibacter sp. UR6-1 TaxID=1435643 RepID=UPI001E293554|nr:S41 family peptidase [Mucilaginibacter sp. UR6-1]MCC8410006.1 hypothetical protein [Mucilaginibacter sp. UR6-1]
MKNLYTILLALLCAIGASAQTASTYQADLDGIYKALKTTPSYKDQIKGERKTRYEALYHSLRAQQPTSSLNEFYLLTRLVQTLRDNHLGFYQWDALKVDPSKLSDSAYVSTYVNSATFNNFPKANVNVDSLEQALTGKPRNGVEGIYYLDDFMKAGVYRTAKPDSLVAVVLSAKQPVWQRGQLLAVFNQLSPGSFEGVCANPVYKIFEYNHRIKFAGNKLNLYYVWNKFPAEADNTAIPAGTPVYQLKNIDNNTQYLRLGRFATDNRSLVESQRFYDSVKTMITASNLIVDVRNNGGGGWKSSKKYLDLITGHSKKAQVYVLVNYATVSNAEQFTLKLKGRKNITVLGADTKGMLAYGSNYGKTETMPSGKYKLYLTDMRDDGNYLQYEDVGVKPDKYLNADSDWIGQVQAIISTK